MTKENNASAVPIIGAWKLNSFEIRADDGRVMYPFGEDAQGSIIYTESGRFAAQVMRRSRPKFAIGDQMKGTPDEIKANYEGFISYFGPYEFNADEAMLSIMSKAHCFLTGRAMPRNASLNSMAIASP